MVADKTGARARPLLLLAASLLAPGLAFADGPSDAARRIGAAGDEALDRASATVAPADEAADAAPEAGGWSFDAMPSTDLYRRYVADPRRPRFAFNHLSVLDSETPESGSRRVATMVGGRYGFLRLHPDDDPDLGFQFDIEAAILAHFDMTSKLDNLGWDGFYGFALSWKPVHGLALRLALNHDSSHIGDEYIEETGRERINYTREELALGVSVEPFDFLRLYAEAALAYHMGNKDDLQERGRVQVGFELETPEPVLWGGHLFAAVDAVFWEENGWEPSVTVMSGLVWHLDTIGRETRVGLQYYDGRSLFGELFRDRERWIALGFWFDF